MAGADAAIDMDLSEWLLIALVLFSLAAETLLHKVDAYIRTRHAHLHPVLNILYRELMILGLASFLFIMYIQIAKPAGSVVLSFEFAHVFLFLLAVFYTVFVLTALLASLRLSARWKALEHTRLQQYLADKARYRTLRLRAHASRAFLWRRVRWWFPRYSVARELRRLHATMAFHDLRFQFLRRYNLPDRFRFAAFLRAAQARVFIQLVDAHWSQRLLFLALILANKGRRWVFPVPTVLVPEGDEDKGDHAVHRHEQDYVWPIFTLVFTSFLILLAQLLARKINSIYWALARNPRLYYRDDLFSPDLKDFPATEGDSTAAVADANTHIPPESGPLPAEDPDHADHIIPSLAHKRPPALSSMGRSFSSRVQPRLATVSSSTGQRDGLRRSRPTRTFPEGGDVEAGPFDDNPFSADAPSASALHKFKSLVMASATIDKNKEHHERAAALQVRSYPRWLSALIPRLNRVASPVEKLFWFGSHQYFLWCVEFVLFFSNVLLAMSASTLFVHAIGHDPILDVMIAATVMSFVALIFVLMRIADIMKSYTFVWLNSGLLPEDLVGEVISAVKRKSRDDDDDSSLIEAERHNQNDEKTVPDQHYEDELDGLQSRQTISEFMRNEAEKGTAPGMVAVGKL